MPFQNPIVAGTTLVRPAIKSPNYVAGVSGWSINRSGTAEFTSLIISGSTITQITITFTDGSQIHAYAGDYTQQVTPAFPQTLQGAWITFRPQTVVGKDWNPGAIGTRYAGGVTQQSALEIWSPYDRNLAVDIQSKISLVNRGEPGGGQRSAITLSCEETHIGLPVTGGTPIEIIVDQITLRKDVIITGNLSLSTGINPGNLSVTGNVTITPGGAATIGTHNLNSSPLYNEPAAHPGSGIVVGSWQAIGSGAFAPFANNFKLRDAAGVADTSYRVDAFGLVTLEGKITGGAASAIGATILTLPAGLRPHTNQFIPVLANGGAITIGQVDINTTGAMIWRGPTVVTGGLNWFALNNINFYAEQ